MEVKSNRIGDVRNHYRQKLANIYPDKEAETMLFILIAEYTGLTRAEILMKPEELITESQLLKIHFGVKALQNHKPIQYVIGKTDFFGLTFVLTPDVLIPRPETEELVDWIIRDQASHKVTSVLDIGSGSGCIAIVLKKHFPNAAVEAVEFSQGAVAVSRKNDEMNNTGVAIKQMDFLDQKQWDNLGKYDLVVSNPPYIRQSEKKEMKLNVLNYEPDRALFVTDNDPLVFYRHIAHFCKIHLQPGGSVYCEVNQYLANETVKLFEELLTRDVELKRDVFGNNRFIKANLQ
jgi:release factor glutamine methyltransferase